MCWQTLRCLCLLAGLVSLHEVYCFLLRTIIGLYSTISSYYIDFLLFFTQPTNFLPQSVTKQAMQRVLVDLSELKMPSSKTTNFTKLVEDTIMACHLNYLCGVVWIRNVSFKKFKKLEWNKLIHKVVLQ